MNQKENEFLNFFFKKLFFDKFLIILCFLIPYLYIAGPLLTEIAIGFITIIFLFKFSKSNNIQNRQKKILIIFLLLITSYFTLNQFLLNDTNNDLYKSFFYFRFLIIIPSIFYILDSKNATKVFLYSILIANLFVVFDIYFQKIFGFDLFGIDALDSYNKGMHFFIYVKNLSEVKRFSGPFGDELIAGGYLSKFFLINLIFLNYELNNTNFKFFKKIKNVLIFGFISLVLICILFTGERTAFIISLISLILFIIFFKFNTKFIIMSLILVATLASLALTNYNLKQRFLFSTLNEVFPLKDDEFISNSFKIETLKKNRHISHYISAYDIFRENVVFGGGYKNYRHICDQDKYTCSTHPHNIFFEIISSVGLIGFFLFYIFFIIYFKLYINKNPRKNLLYCLYIFLNFLFILPTGSIFNNHFGVLSFFSLAAFMVCLENLDNDRKYFKRIN